MVDIGGGSTEFTLGLDEQILGAVSLQLGAVRMNAQTPVCSVADYEDAVTRSLRVIRRDAKRLLALPARDYWVGVGGTLTTLGAMKRGVPVFDPDTCEGMSMSLGEVASWGRLLAGATMEERRRVVGLMPHRADIIPCGIAILEAAMRAFNVEQLRLSAHGNMDGYLKRRFARDEAAV